tara:strand:- start:1812 stop:2213 length:402 start_codon:yes stop_codon:yes gene_type:complete
MFKYLPLFISGIMCGLIIYQSIVIAPSINELLNKQDASTYLRYIWPKFFLITAFLSVVAGLIIQFSNLDQNFAKIVFIVSAVLMLICFFAIPFMNDARDSDAENLFFILHAGSMIFTLIVLVLNLLILIYWKY